MSKLPTALEERVIRMNEQENRVEELTERVEKLESLLNWVSANQEALARAMASAPDFQVSELHNEWQKRRPPEPSEQNKEE